MHLQTVLKNRLLLLARMPANTIECVRCLSAIRQLGDVSTERLVDFSFSPAIAPVQVRSELLEFANTIAELRPSNALEIGSFHGGTLFLICRLAAPNARVISVDKYLGRFGGGYHPARRLLYRSFTRNGQNLHLLQADSHSLHTHTRVVRKLSGAPLDFLFIDGDHSYEGVKRDFELYSPLVRPGGIIAFHDIAEHPSEPSCKVSVFWNEIKSWHRHREIIENTSQGWGGIGLLHV